VESHMSTDGKAQLSRLQFYCALIRLAIAKYVQPKEILDVSEALQTLLSADLIGVAKGRTSGFGWTAGAFLEKNAFRLQHLYTEDISHALAAKETSLRRLFNAICASSRDYVGGGGRGKTLLSVNEWLGFLYAAELVGSDVSDREAAMCFAWSRMTIVDGSTQRGMEKESNLSFEDFLEALSRLAVLKALPTLDELTAAGFTRLEDVYAYLAQVDLATWNMMVARSPGWGEPPFQPVLDSIQMTISLIEGVIEGDWSDGKVEGELSKKEASEWVRRAMQAS